MVARGLAVLLIAWVAAYHLVVALRGQFEPDFDLPLHLTDIVTVIAALALWSRSPLLFELTYFWGLTAALLAVLTPGLDPEEGFPSFFFWHYFITHSGVVLAALFLAFGLGMTARSGAVRRVFLATLHGRPWPPPGTSSPAATTCSSGSDRKRRAFSTTWALGRGTSSAPPCSL